MSDRIISLMPYRLYIFDLDGTIYRGSQALPGAVETLATLRRCGALVRFITNNSGATAESLAGKLRAMGIEARADEIVGSGDAAARYCVADGIASVFLVGEPGLVKTFESVGLQVVNKSPKGTVADEAVNDAQAVVAGICRSFTYSLLRSAMGQVLSGARFVATNTDAAYPVENGGLEPGAGAIVAALRACTQVEPYVVGKPRPDMILWLLQASGCRPEEAIVVGDRVDTDIAAGKAAGCATHLVLSGVTASPHSEGSWSQDLRGVPLP